MLETIVYTSRVILPDGVSPSVRPVWLDGLVKRAAAKNKANNISGVLSYKDGRVIQLIEGESVRLHKLYAKISSDPRHHNVLTLLDIKDSHRIFSDWGMVLEATIESSSLFRDFLYTHFDQLAEMTENRSDELLFFSEHIFHEVAQSASKNYLH